MFLLSWDLRRFGRCLDTTIAVNSKDYHYSTLGTPLSPFHLPAPRATILLCHLDVSSTDLHPFRNPLVPFSSAVPNTPATKNATYCQACISTSRYHWRSLKSRSCTSRHKVPDSPPYGHPSSLLPTSRAIRPPYPHPPMSLLLPPVKIIKPHSSSFPTARSDGNSAATPAP